MSKITKRVVAFGRPIVIGCDAKCSKAWGATNRPRVQLSENPDDYFYLSDDEAGDAPLDPGTYEGGDAKPMNPYQRLNKWCFRECERCESAPDGLEPVLPDFTKRQYNIPDSDPDMSGKSDFAYTIATTHRVMGHGEHYDVISIPSIEGGFPPLFRSQKEAIRWLSLKENRSLLYDKPSIVKIKFFKSA